MADTRLLVDRIETPLGMLRVVVTPHGELRQLGWLEEKELPAGVEAVVERDPFGVSSVLRAYFAGRVGAIDALRVDGAGTPFQRLVWQALRAIPAGETTSYGELAARIGSPRAVRAVGGANHVNPIGIVVPCHRVIGKNGGLTGYAGGLDRKRWLLAHEARHATGARGKQIELRALT
ncbi:MAG TPA: methylated-DNA--[protein]-cysteine S-methyltransferase [Polyangiaceae bacterium]